CSAWGASSRSTNERIDTRKASCSAVKNEVATAGIEAMIVGLYAKAPTSATATASTCQVPSRPAGSTARLFAERPAAMTMWSRPAKVTPTSSTEEASRRADTRTEEIATGQLVGLETFTVTVKVP